MKQSKPQDKKFNPLDKKWIVRGAYDGKRISISQGIKTLPYWVLYVGGAQKGFVIVFN